MRHLPLVLSLLAVVLLGLVALGRGATAQDATPIAEGGHPLIGAWVLDTDADDPANPPALLVVHADGTLVELHEREADGIGSWAMTGERTAALTIVFHEVDEDLALEGTIVVRVAVEVGVGGQGFTAPYTVEFVGPDGTTSGEIGPATAVGARIGVEAMGTPVMTFEDALGEGGSPEATPAT